MLADLELEDIEATAQTALYNGGSLWARYWTQTVGELRPRLEDSGHLDRRSIDTFLAHCDEPDWWTQTIAFTAISGRTPNGGRAWRTSPSAWPEGSTTTLAAEFATRDVDATMASMPTTRT